MNEFSAAAGLTNLESMNDFIEINRQNYKQFARELTDVEGITLVTYDDNEKCNYQYVVLEVDANSTVVSRDQLMQVLHSENILARRYFYPGCHQMEPYRSSLPAPDLPETERLSDRVLSLPTGTSISAADIKTICGIIRMVVANGREVAGRIRPA
jgi:dTDP-4-amino-4,6-dideoxygalactose transaminase